MDIRPSLHRLILLVFLQRSRGDATNANIFRAEAVAARAERCSFPARKKRGSGRLATAAAEISA
jgi:hypothetical protein